ncbi:hypothetical protein SBF1_2180001 [Candidatus Desulfosporosinus infrequens]|uniref:Uncharacterized protein n=1 Tax=Candidatus Desulfosporosinus infrequens TaxID=2043169 RepID=A0A2U3KKE0_9FIRM|nr:hypothetical protein SBF1_2180001 [Candidatus Desulfosporosinus infrequens]
MLIKNNRQLMLVNINFTYCLHLMSIFVTIQVTQPQITQINTE